MSHSTEPVDFDTRPPVPVAEYEQTVRRVNVGYELIFTLTHALLRALSRDKLDLLVVGAGGGMEVATFGPANPGWRFTGVDPSRDMLALTQEKVDALSLSDRVTLVRGTVDDLPPTRQFDAATCLFVLHFVPDESSKLALLRGVGQRLKAGAPLILVNGVRNYSGHFEEFEDALKHYGELMGMSPEAMVGIIEQVKGRQEGATSEERHVALLREAGLAHVTRFFSAFTLAGWIARLETL